MARTKTITVSTGQATKKPATRGGSAAIPMSATALQVTQQSTTAPAEGDGDTELRRADPEDEETKGDHEEPLREDDGSQNNPYEPVRAEEPNTAAVLDDQGQVAAETTDTAANEMTALSSVLLQLSDTMARMNARLDNLEVAVTTTMSQTTAPASSHHDTAIAAPAVDGQGTAEPTQRRVAYTLPDGGDGDDDDSSSSSDSSDEDGGGDGDGGTDQRNSATPARRAVTAPAPRHGRRKNIRDLELTTFQPSPNNSVSTWIKKVDLALEGARISGRGDWTDGELYYIVGNKLQDDTARFWVQADQGMRPETRTWTHLKAALKRRYGERPDKSQAELRVNQRYLMPGETFADFAAGLREARGENKVSERVLLAQFIRNLPKTTRQLVRESKPKTLDQAVDKATEVDDPFDNVALGMKNIGQEWITAQMGYPPSVSDAPSRTMVVPGIGVRDVVKTAAYATQADPDYAIFSNPQGAWNKYSGIWDIPEGRVWNGRYWAVKPLQKRIAKPATEEPAKKPAAAPKPEKKVAAKVKMARMAEADDESESDDETDDAALSPRPTKRHRTTKRSKAAARPVRAAEQPRQDPEPPQTMRPMGQVTCYACGQAGHFAKECPDSAAKARNDAYLATRAQRTPMKGNEERAP